MPNGGDLLDDNATPRLPSPGYSKSVMVQCQESNSSKQLLRIRVIKGRQYGPLLPMHYACLWMWLDHSGSLRGLAMMLDTLHTGVWHISKWPYSVLMLNGINMLYGRTGGRTRLAGVVNVQDVVVCIEFQHSTSNLNFKS